MAFSKAQIGAMKEKDKKKGALGDPMKQALSNVRKDYAGKTGAGHALAKAGKKVAMAIPPKVFTKAKGL